MADTESIFVSVASYRDDECPNTIKSIFEKAKNPSRIYVGICQQNESIDVDCDLSSIYKGHVRILKIPSTEARGPCKARYLCSLLYKDEDYFYQIDSHMRLAQDWDSKYISMFKKLEKKSSKPVISYYPNSFEPNRESDIEKDDTVGRICSANYNHDIISFNGASLIKKTEEPPLSGFATGGSMFLKGTFLNEVPFDPDLDDLFIGEEILFTARLWTWGYDIYSPNENLIWHYYTRSDSPKFWDDWNDNKKRPQSKNEKSSKKVKHILGISVTDNIDVGKYGLGPVRSLDDFYKFIGFDKSTKTIYKNFCEDLDDYQPNNIENNDIHCIFFIILLLIAVISIFSIFVIINSR